MPEAAFFAGENVDGFVGVAKEAGAFEARLGGYNGRCGYGAGRKGVGFGGGRSFFGDGFVGFGGSFVGNRDGGLFAGGATVDFNPILVEPEFDLVVARLFLGWHLENLDVDFATTVKVTNNGVSELGDGAGADVAFDTVFVFVHEEEGVGLVEVLIELLVEFGHALGIGCVALANQAAEGKTGSGRGLGERVFVLKDGAGPVDDFVAATFEIASPIKRTFIKFRTARNDQLSHSFFSELVVL